MYRCISGGLTENAMVYQGINTATFRFGILEMLHVILSIYSPFWISRFFSTPVKSKYQAFFLTTYLNTVISSLYREEFFTTLLRLCRTRHWLLRKRQCMRDRKRVGDRQRSLLPLIFLSPWQSFASRKKRQNYGSEEIESNRFNKQKKNLSKK